MRSIYRKALWLHTELTGKQADSPFRKKESEMNKKVIWGTIAVLSCALPASWGEGKVTICHFPPGNPANVQIITIGASAVPHHVGNHVGDKIYLGPGDSCSADVTPPTPNPGPS